MGAKARPARQCQPRAPRLTGSKRYEAAPSATDSAQCTVHSAHTSPFHTFVASSRSYYAFLQFFSSAKLHNRGVDARLAAAEMRGGQEWRHALPPRAKVGPA